MLAFYGIMTFGFWCLMYLIGIFVHDNPFYFATLLLFSAVIIVGAGIFIFFLLGMAGLIG